MKLSPQSLFIAYIVFMAAVSSLEPPKPDAPYWVRWAYRFVNALAVNLPNRFAGHGPQKEEKP